MLLGIIVIIKTVLNDAFSGGVREIEDISDDFFDRYFLLKFIHIYSHKKHFVLGSPGRINIAISKDEKPFADFDNQQALSAENHQRFSV